MLNTFLMCPRNFKVYILTSSSDFPAGKKTLYKPNDEKMLAVIILTVEDRITTYLYTYNDLILIFLVNPQLWDFNRALWSLDSKIQTT